MEKCRRCSRGPKSIYHVGKCPKFPIFEIPFQGLSIKTNGQVIGKIESWKISEPITEPIYEINTHSGPNRHSPACPCPDCIGTSNKLPSQVEEAVNKHVEEHRCQLRDRPTESFTYHLEYEIGNARVYWWIGECDVCHRTVRVQVEPEKSDG